MTDAGRRPWRLGALLFAVLAVPLVITAVALHEPRWFPSLDLAMTELRVRDVGTSDTPLIGLPGRIGTLEEQGSHPGPLSFYLLAPVYRLLGSSAWSLQVGALLLSAAAMATSLALACRRGGATLVTAVAAILALLAAAYGFPVLSEPWNPYLPVLWWVAFLLACWGVADGDRWLLPVAVAVGSLCAQTHLPYAGLAVGVGVGSLVLAVWAGRAAEDGLRSLRAPLLAAFGVAALLWAPVGLDQVTVDPGNAGLVLDHFRDPPEDPVGVATGLHVLLVHLDLRPVLSPLVGDAGTLTDGFYDPSGSIVPGLVLLGAWLVSVAVAWRRSLRGWLRLDLVLGGALVLGVVSAANVFGKVWYYLTLWAWGVAALMVVAIAGTVVQVLPPARRDRTRAVARTALIVGVVASSAHLAWQARQAEVSEPTLSRGLSLVVGPTEAALRDGIGDADGVDGRYVVTWSDVVHIGSQGYGLVSELERDGFDVGVRDHARAPVTPHRVVPPEEVTAVVHFATGGAIDHWRDKPGVVEAVHVDPRTPAERAEYERIEGELAADLRDAGLDELADRLSVDVFGASLDDRLDDEDRRRFSRLLELGLPMSVFIAPADVDPF